MRHEKSIDVVLGLGFGDEGKGKTVDWLLSKHDAKNKTKSIVIRFNGGQQAGHTVYNRYSHHVHANFGSGATRGVASYFSEHTTFYPPSIIAEYKLLPKDPSLTLHPLAMMTLPEDIAYQKATTRGFASCERGIGTTMKRNESFHKIHAIDMLNWDVLKAKSALAHEYYADLLDNHPNGVYLKAKYAEELRTERDYFRDSVTRLLKFVIVEDYTNLLKYDHLIFEGAQGIMLDMDHGFFPYVTYSNTTSKNVVEIISKLEPNYNDTYECKTWYATRAYQTRHGDGPMTGVPMTNELKNVGFETNKYNTRQGTFRSARLDYGLIRHALSIDALHSMVSKKHIVVNCLDQVVAEDFRFNDFIDEFVDYSVYGSKAPESETIKAAIKWKTPKQKELLK